MKCNGCGISVGKSNEECMIVYHGKQDYYKCFLDKNAHKVVIISRRGGHDPVRGGT